MDKLQIVEQRDVLGKEFRIYGTKEEPLFLAKDVAEWIGNKNVTMMLKNIDEDDVTKLNLGGLQGATNFLTEDGLYEVLMLSRKPIAREFKKQVKLILKQIRQDGGYINVNDNDDESTIMAKALIVAQRTIERKSKELVEAERRNAILMHTNKTYTATEIAKELGFKSAAALNKDLCDKGIQYKVNKTYVLKSDYSDLGYISIKQQILDTGSAVYNRHFTQDGRNFILNLYNN